MRAASDRQVEGSKPSEPFMLGDFHRDSQMITIFRIGLILAIAGIIWTGFEFYEGEKVSSVFDLKSEDTESLEMILTGDDLGFYKVSVPELGDSMLVRVFDSDSNVIADKRIETRSSVNYFEIDGTGYYTLQITNLSDHDFEVSVEFGNTNASEMKYSGLMIVSGIVLVFIAAYQKMRYSYSIAQPDEKR